MNAKKFLALILATLMLALACPLSAFADDPAIAEVTIDYPESSGTADTTTQCATWTEVTTAASAPNLFNVNGDYSVRPQTIVTIKILVASIEIDTSIKFTTNCSVVLDGEYAPGQRATITATPDKLNDYNYGDSGVYEALIRTNTNATVKNLVYEGAGLILAKCDAGPADVVLENVSITTEDGSSPIAINNGVTPMPVKFDGCDITNSSDTNVISIVGMNDASTWPKDVSIELKDTVITQNGGSADDNAIIAYKNHADFSKLTVNVVGDTTLNYNSGVENGSMFMLNTGSAEFNFGSETDDASGVTLNLGPAAGGTIAAEMSEPSFFRRAASLVINDNGADWTVDEGITLANGGFTFIYKDGEEGVDNPVLAESVLAITADDTLYSPINAYLAGGKTYKTLSVTIEGKRIENLDGAAARIAAPNGLRFHAKVNSDFYENYGQYVTYGFKITTLELLTQADGNIEAAEEVVTAEISWEVEGDILVADVKNISEDDYDTTYVFVSYAQFEFDGGDAVTYWSDYAAREHSRSLKQVAKAALADSKYSYTAESKAILEAIAS